MGRLTPEEFKALDYRVMRHAFESQNELGRFCDEAIYQNDLVARLKAAGFAPVRCELPVTITHGSFRKTYYLDLVVSDAAIYELKATNGLVKEDQTQILNYLFLLDQPRGKLVNFRPPAVESWFANTTLQTADRRDYRLITRRWQELDERSVLLQRVLTELLVDWGAFLDVALYLEAVIHFLGGESVVIRPTAITRDGLALGAQRFPHLNESTGFRFTAFTETPETGERHLTQFLKHTELQAIQWVNFNHHQIEMTTILRP